MVRMWESRLRHCVGEKRMGVGVRYWIGGRTMRQLRRRSRRTLKVCNMGGRCGWESRVMHWV